MFRLSLPCIRLPDISIYCKHLNTRWKKCNTCLVKITHWNYGWILLKTGKQVLRSFRWMGYDSCTVKLCVFVFLGYHSAPVIVLDVSSKHTSMMYL